MLPTVSLPWKWAGAGFSDALIDSSTDERLAGVVVARVGGKGFEGKLSGWSDVKAAADLVAEKARERMAELRAP